MSSRKNMTLKVLWNRYVKKCRDSGLKLRNRAGEAQSGNPDLAAGY